MLTRDNIYPYQNTGIAHILNRNGSMLWLDMGLGKTVITLTAIERLLDQYKVSAVLVLAPLAVVKAVWRQEAERWQHTKHLRVTAVVSDDPKERVRMLQTPADVYLINYEQLQWLLGRTSTKKVGASRGVLFSHWIDKGKRLPFDAVVFDEISKLKKATSKRAKAFAKILPQMRYRIGLTGTPAANGLPDLHGQFLMIDGGKRLGPNITGFRNRWLIQSPYNHKWLPRKGAPDEIKELVSDITLEMKEEDYLDLPPLITQDINIELPPAILKQYKDFEDEFFLELDSAEIEAFNSGAKSTKCRQLANGACYVDESGRDWVKAHDLKLDALADLAESLGDKTLIVFYQFTHDLERILARFPDAVAMTSKNTAEAVTQWNAGEIKMMVCHPASAGHGLNLQHGGNHIAWFGLPWSLEHYLQAIARLKRQGQKAEAVVNHRLLVDDTVEQAISEALKAKDATQTTLRAAVKEYRTRQKLI